MYRQVASTKGKVDRPQSTRQRRWGFEATIAVSRKDFGLQWNSLIELGNVAVADEVQTAIQIVAMEA